MRIRVKKHHGNNVIKLESFGDIKEINFNEDLLNPQDEIVSLLFRGHMSSGIIDLKPEDVEKIYNTIAEKKRLIKDFKIIKDKK